MKMMKRICSMFVCICMLLGMVYLPAKVSAAETQYGNIVLVDEDFSDVSDLTIPSAGKVITPGQYLKLDGTAGTAIASYSDLETDFVITRSWIAVKEHTFDLKLAEGASVIFELNTVFKSTESDGSIVNHNEFISCKLEGNTFTLYGSNSQSITVEIPETVDTTEWNTYALRVTRNSPYGGDYSLELLVNNELLLDGSSDSTMRIVSQNQNSNNGLTNGLKFIVAGGIAEVDNFSMVGRERNWKTINDAHGVSIKQWLEFKDRNDALGSDDFGAAGTAMNAKWENTGNVTLVPETGSNSTPYLRITQEGGKTAYFDYPYADINGGMIPFDQVTTYEFDASFAGGGELGLVLYGSRTFDGGVQAIRYLSAYLRPAIDDMPAGVYVNVDGVRTLVIDLSDVDMDSWNKFAFELNLNGAQEAYCYVNGVKRTGKISLNNLGYSETNANLKKCQMWLSSTGPVGYVDVDNVKLHYTMWGPAPDFASDAVLSVTNMTDNGFDISWPAAANATSYDVYLDGVKKATTTETSYTFSGLAMKAYGVKVVANSVNNPNVTDELSNVALLVGEGDIENFATAFGKNVRYDDYIDLSKAPYSIGDKAVGILEQYPTSYAVGTTTKDTAVVTYDAATKTLHAVGVGSAKIVIGDQVYSIGVEAAPISLFMTIGHSVGAGSKGDATQSIVCEPGQVYSSHESEAVSMVKTHGVGGTLRSENQNLTLHTYEQLASMGIGGAAASRPNGIDALTAAGNGTVASDSGFAYQWNKLTGEKVWILNAAVGGTNQTFWMPDAEEYWANYTGTPKDELDLTNTDQWRIYMYGAMYDHSVDLFQKAQTVLANEIAAGHYTLSHMGMFAFTGANGDEWRNPTEAAEMFTTMWEGYKEDLAMDMDGDGQDETVESVGIMPIYHLNQSDPYAGGEIYINYTKAVNHFMAASAEYPDVYLTALDHRQWVTNEGVAEYFADYDFSYTIQSGAAITRPTTVDELFPVAKSDYVHYQQMGYNALGQEMAKRTNQYYSGDKGTDDITIINAAKNWDDRKTPIQDLVATGPIKLAKNEVYRFAVLMAPGGVTIEASGAISLDSGILGAVKAASSDGVGYLTVKDGDTVLKTVTFLVGDAVLPHECTPGEVQIENETESTCEVAGTYDEVTYCTECGEEMSRTQQTKDLAEHTPGDTEIENETEGTCQVPGTYEEVVYCSVCGEELSREQKDGELAECIPGEVQIENETFSTCQQAGTYDEVIYCTVCGEELSRTQQTKELAECIPGEAVFENETEGTCQVPGTYEEVVYCSVCGEELSRVQKDGELAACKPGEIQIENETFSTCQQAGTYDEVVYCTVCGEELSRTQQTKELAACIPGNTVYENEVEASCTVPGYYEEVVYCSVCGEELSRTPVFGDTTPHTVADIKIENEIEASCSAPGSYDKVAYCACGHEIERVTFPMDQLDHTESDIVIENDTESSCSVPGSYDEVVYCTVCGEELSRETTYKDLLDHVYDDKNDADCNTCGYERYVEPSIAVVDGNIVTTGSLKDGWKVGIFYIGAEVVENPQLAENWNVLVEAGQQYPAVNGKNGYIVYTNGEGLPTLTKGGNWVLYLKYENEEGKTKAQYITYTAPGEVEPPFQVPTIAVDENKQIIVTDPQNAAASVIVFYVGENGLAEVTSASAWTELVKAGRKYHTINGVGGYQSYTDMAALPELKVAGDYVLFLKYVRDGEQLSVAITHTVAGEVYFRPTATVDNGELKIELHESDEFVKAFVFYTGETTFTDYTSGAAWVTLVKEGKKYAINGANGYRTSVEMADLPELTEGGQYYVFVRYIDAYGITRSVAVPVVVE